MQLNELHDRLYDVLCAIDDAAKKGNARYFLGFGTALGAVREKDFIPWDDDMDLQVRMEDYPAFKAAMEEYLPPYMHLIEPDVFDPAFHDFIFRIYDDRYTLREENEADRYYGNYQNHVGTDVFLISRVPSNSLAQKLTVIKTKILYGLGMAHRYHVDDSKYTLMQKLQSKVLISIGKFFTTDSIIKAWLKVATKYNGKKTGVCMVLNAPLHYIRPVSTDIYKGTAKGSIRGRNFPITKGYDEELSLYYGDYMKPPKDITAFVQHLDQEGKDEQERLWEEAKKAE